MTLRWGIIGCGDVAERKGGPALYGVEDSELIAVMRRDAVKAADFARRHGARRWYNRAEDLLGDPGINAVYVATPVHLHHHCTIQAAKAGKHVLCEKPMAMNVHQCREMITTCRESGVYLMVAYYRRTYPIVQRIKQVLEEGTIGEPVLVRINLTGYYAPDPDTPGAWRTRPEIAGGGVMFDVGSHRLDVMVYLLGEVQEVAALVHTVHCRYEVEDSAVLSMSLSAGLHGVANFNWNVGSGTDEFEIYGTEGKILARPLDGGHLEIHQGKNSIETVELPPPTVTHWGLVENLVHAVRAGTPLISPGEEGIKTSLIMAAAYRSAEERRRINLAEM